MFQMCLACGKSLPSLRFNFQPAILTPPCRLKPAELQMPLESSKTSCPPKLSAFLLECSERRLSAAAFARIRSAPQNSHLRSFNNPLSRLMAHRKMKRAAVAAAGAAAAAAGQTKLSNVALDDGSAVLAPRADTSAIRDDASWRVKEVPQCFKTFHDVICGANQHWSIITSNNWLSLTQSATPDPPAVCSLTTCRRSPHAVVRRVGAEQRSIHDHD